MVAINNFATTHDDGNSNSNSNSNDDDDDDDDQDQDQDHDHNWYNDDDNNQIQIIIMAIKWHSDGFDDRQQQLRCDGNDALAVLLVSRVVKEIWFSFQNINDYH